MSKARVQGQEAYVRVLLSWYRSGKPWIYVSDQGETSVEALLLNALTNISDPELRREVQETLVKGPPEQADTKGENREMTGEEEPAAKEHVPTESEATASSERIEGVEDQAANHELSPEQAQKILENLRQMRRKLKTDEHG